MVWTYRREAKSTGQRPIPQAEAILDFVRRTLGFEPDERQRELLLSEAKRLILNCARQWGKSTVAAMMAVYRAYTRPGSLVLVASPGERQSAEFIRKAREWSLNWESTPRGDGDNAISLLFPNGSRIVGLPGMEATVRGFSAVSLLLIDEASRVEPEMYKALRPMLAVGGGDLWMMSTPNGKQGFFYEAWEHGGEDWKRFSATAADCARIDREFLEKERGELGPCGSGRSICANSWITGARFSIEIWWRRLWMITSSLYSLDERG